MASLTGLPLRIAAEWVAGLSGSERLQALEMLMLCDPYGVAKVPPKAKAIATKLHWQYIHGILVVPAWPLRPPNPNVRFAWIRSLDERIGDSAEGQAIARSLAVAWGGTYYPVVLLPAVGETELAVQPGTPLRTDPSTNTDLQTISAAAEPLILQEQPLFPEGVQRGRHVPLPPGSRLVHGAHGNYYVTSGRVIYPECFERFWKAYPRPVEKAEAYGVYLAMDPDPAEQEAIVQGAIRYAANPYTHADGQKHVPYPQRWLRRRRFLDEDVAIPCRTHQEISDHFESRSGGTGGGLTPEDYR